MTVKTRFAPSPTGYLHVGGARTALFSWLYAKKLGGQFVLRIEDTDLERSTQESVDAILEGMSWLGLDYDEGPYYQTKRFDRYNEVIDELLASGKAYRCSCSKERLDELRESQMAAKQKPRYDGHCRGLDVDPNEPHVIRFANPTEGEVTFTDMVKGDITVSNSELDDLIIRRTDGSPTYNLTVVVDDHDMGITHVVRGDDHINNTPRQINLAKAMGWDVPEFAHLPMILGDDGARLSKRHGAVSVMQYRDNGYLPEGLLNYLVRLGWSHGDQELFSVAEMQDLFSLQGVNRAPSAFNTEKLNWVNQQYIKEGDVNRLAELMPFYFDQMGLTEVNKEVLPQVIEAQRERASTMVELAEICAFYFKDFEEYDPKATKKAFKGDADSILEKTKEKLAALASWEREVLHECVSDTVAELEVGFGKVAMPLRIAVTGGSPSPDLDLTLFLVGKEAVLRRIDKAVEHIRASA